MKEQEHPLWKVLITGVAFNSSTSTGGHGTVTVAADGHSVVYNPGTAFDYLNIGQSATDTFTYTINDGNGSYHHL